MPVFVDDVANMCVVVVVNSGEQCPAVAGFLFVLEKGLVIKFIGSAFLGCCAFGRVLPMEFGFKL